MSKTTVLYKDVAPGAEESVSVSGTGYWAQSNLDKLPAGVEPEAVATLERNNWALDGAFQFYDTQTLGFWSTAMSDAQGAFATPLAITCTLPSQYTSTGVTLMFDRQAGGYCSAVNIKWYQGAALKVDIDFYPDDTTYFCKQTVKSWDKIVITIKKTSIPFRRAKIERILFGVHRSFGMTELRNATVVNEMDGSAETLPISTFKWRLDSREDVDFLFQLKQPVEVYNDSNLLGVYYIDKHSRETARIYDIECYDAIGVLDESTFAGGVYQAKSAKALLQDIVGSDFALEYGADVADATLTGILQSGSKRNAMLQVLFAWGVCAATDGGHTIKVFTLPSDPAEIGTNRTFPGVSVETEAVVTEVRVTAHSYTQADNGSIEINGIKYNDTKTVYPVANPDVTANDKQNIKEITGSTLVSPANAQAVAQRVYDWYQRRSTAKGRVVWRGAERLGGCVSLPNSWGSTHTGNLSRMEITLSNTVVASCEVIEGA